jgi:uncharacterized protein
MVDYFQIYQDQKSEWRWRFVSDNGRIIAVSSEAYSSRVNCEASITIMKTRCPTAVVI